MFPWDIHDSLMSLPRCYANRATTSVGAPQETAAEPANADVHSRCHRMTYKDNSCGGKPPAVRGCMATRRLNCVM